MNKQISRYFLAKVVREKAWFVSGCVRNTGHIALERGLIPQDNIFEFFVAPMHVGDFCCLMDQLQAMGTVIWYKEALNRLASQ